MKLWQSAVITAVVSAGSVLAYRALFEPGPTVVVVTAPAPPAPPPRQVVTFEPVAVAPPDDEPEQAEPPPPCIHRGRADTEEEAQSLFEEAVSAMRNKDMREGCCLLDHIVDEAPDDCIWVTKAENLSERRCDDDDAEVDPPAPPKATRRAVEGRIRRVLDRDCTGSRDVLRSVASLNYGDTGAVTELELQISLVEALCEK